MLCTAVLEAGLRVFLCVVNLSLRRIREGYTVLLRCLSNSLHPVQLPPLRNVGTWPLHVMSRRGENLSNALSHL